MQYGIDIGGTKMELGVFDAQLNTVAVQRIETPTKDYDEFLGAIEFLINEADNQTKHPGSVGIGLPCIVNMDGKAVSSNIPCINNKLLCNDISDRLHRYVGFGNDSETFALSEAVYGAGRGYSKVLGVIVGTGVNSALCEDGKLFSSRNRMAGEWGHAIISAVHQQRYNLPLRECGCGGIGCVERYVSGKGLEWLYTHFGGSPLEAQKVVAAMRAGEEQAARAFECFLDIMAHGLAQLVLYYDPDVIVIGGGISNVAELYTELPKRLPKYLFKGVKAPDIVAAEYGDSSGVRGAAILGRRDD